MRLQILYKIGKALIIPQKEISPSAPKIISVTIKPEQIGTIIEPGGKVVDKIRKDMGDNGTLSM